jgi:DNA-binding transcriptional LysR family regulator
MSAAGREMGLSPAVVSKRISQLEERLGARLFPAHDTGSSC